MRIGPACISAAAAALLLCGCSAGPKPASGGGARPLAAVADARVAVLPFDNQSTDVSAAEYVRGLVQEKFQQWGYQPEPAGTVDEKLKALGITDGGQLGAVAPAAVGKELGVPLLCYGEVEDFTFQNLGFIIRKSVKLNLKVVSAQDGAVLFDGSGKGKDMKVYFSREDAERAFMEAAAIKLVQNMLKLPLKKETQAAVNDVFGEMPRR